MADRLGFPVVFVCAAVISTISLVVLMRRVRDPRHLAPAA
jgi:hypothetical protein